MDINVLIVDDEIFSVETLKGEIHWESYGISKVFCAYNAEEARDIILSEPINLVLCDIEMPGENGLELIEWVKEGTNLKGLITEFVILTCHPEYEFMRKAMQIGCSDYLLKPLDYRELHRVLKKAVGNIHEKEAQIIRLETFETIVSESDKTNIVQEKIIPYILNNLTQGFNVTDLAERVALNPQYMMRLFKKSTGQSIIEYVTSQKMIVAKRLLEETDWNNDIIAQKVGYISTSYFISMFKKYFDKTPREYRKTV